MPATLTVDGKEYPNVGVRFRGASSLGRAGEGYKRSLNVSMDLADKKQRLHGYKTLNLLNAHARPDVPAHGPLLHVARQYIPAPKANFVKVVINGESWGVYVNVAAVQQGLRQRVLRQRRRAPGGRCRAAPGGGGGLEYLGEDVEQYKRRYEIKSKDDAKAWDGPDQAVQDAERDAGREARGGAEADPGRRRRAVVPGAGERAGQQRRVLDPRQRLLHLPGPQGRVPPRPARRERDVPARRRAGLGRRRVAGAAAAGRVDPAGRAVGRVDWRAGRRSGWSGRPAGRADRAASWWRRGGGPGGGGGGGSRPADRRVDVNPADATKPLRSKLLAVPALREKYLRNVRTIANDWLDWEKLSPVVSKYRELIEKEVEADTRKLEGGFEQAIAGEAQQAADGGRGRGRGRRPSLKAFVEQRRTYLLNYPEIKKLDAARPRRLPPPHCWRGALARRGAPRRRLGRRSRKRPAPEKAADLFGETKVWDVHLTFTPEQFAAMEPEGGGPGGAGGPPRGFGPGMFLGPVFAQAGDSDGDRKLSRDEFRGAGREMVRGVGQAEGRQGRRGAAPRRAERDVRAAAGRTRRWSRPRRARRASCSRAARGSATAWRRRSGSSSSTSTPTSNSRASTFKDVAVRYKGNGTFIQSRSGAEARPEDRPRTSSSKDQKPRRRHEAQPAQRRDRRQLDERGAVAPPVPRRRRARAAHGVRARVRHRPGQARAAVPRACIRSSRTSTGTFAQDRFGTKKAARSSSP